MHGYCLSVLTGFLLALGCSVCYGTASVLQAVAARSVEAGSDSGVDAVLLLRAARQWRYLAGIGLDGLGFVLQVMALRIVPIYVVVNEIRALDNIWTLVVLYTAMNLPIAVWMMRSFFLEVPTELLEAASIDGASLGRTLREVVLPIISPGIFATRPRNWNGSQNALHSGCNWNAVRMP